MPRPLRVLLLEDRALDAELMLGELRQAGFEPEWQRVWTERDYVAQLERSLDVILADYSLPSFDAPRALQLLQASGLDTPFIVVTGTVSEEAAVECMKQGATDYLLKDRLARLGGAVTHALEQVRLRDAKRRADQEVRESERRFRELLETAPDAIVITDDIGRIVLVNSETERLFGYERDKILGQSDTLLLPNGHRHEPASQRVNPVAASADSITGAGQELKAQRKDGTGVDVEITLGSLPTAEGVLVTRVIRDITERKRAESELQMRVRQQAAVASLGQLALTGIDIAELMEQTVGAVARTLDLECSQILELLPDGQSFESRASVGWQAGLTITTGADAMAWYTLRADGPVVVKDFAFETRFQAPQFLHADGIVSGVALVVGGQEQPFGILAAYARGRNAFTEDDVHFLQSVANTLAAAIERRRAEHALRASNERLETVLAELRETQAWIIQQERLRALGEMASGIAHDLNNTLAMILGYSELLLERPVVLVDEVQTRSDLNMIHLAAEDAASTVARLREFYRPRAADDAIERLDIGELIVQAVALTQPRWRDEARASGINIDVAVDINDAPAINGSPGDLREALINLILNAVDAMPLGGMLTLRSLGEGQRVVVEVSDTGTGISDELLSRVFEPFFTTKGTRGTGLGLATVSGIVQRHDGSIAVTSNPGQGTTFRIVLPIVNDKAEHAQPSRSDGAPRPLKILLVEDQPQIRHILTRFLAIDGHSVKTAIDGQEGAVTFDSERFDIVITDRAMPKMSGDQFARSIKERALNVRVIMLTGFGEMMRATNEIPPGVDLIVSKPVTLARLRQALTEVIEQDS